MIELETCMATQSWVNREYRRGLSTHPCGVPVLRICEVEVLIPTFTTWGRPVRKSRTQGPELSDELVGYYDYSSAFNTNEQHSDVGIPLFQVG
jgi:hypothetical protein